MHFLTLRKQFFVTVVQIFCLPFLTLSYLAKGRALVSIWCFCRLLNTVTEWSKIWIQHDKIAFRCLKSNHSWCTLRFHSVCKHIETLIPVMYFKNQRTIMNVQFWENWNFWLNMYHCWKLQRYKFGIGLLAIFGA